jgi:hypothetical protein
LFDAVHERIVFRDEDARTRAVQRFHLNDGDFVLEIGFRAVVEYDEALARNLIVKILPIPASYEDSGPGRTRSFSSRLLRRPLALEISTHLVDEATVEVVAFRSTRAPFWMFVVDGLG